MDEGQEFIADKQKKGLKKKSGTGGGFVVLDKDKRPSSAVLATENKKKQNIRDQIQKSSEGFNPKDKFDTQVKFPGQEYIQSSSPSGLQAQQQSATQAMRPKTSGEQAREAADQAKKERRMELTQQLMALHSQGFIKNLPTDELISSIEASNEIYGAGSYMNARSSKGQFDPKSHLGGYLTRGSAPMEESQGLRQYEVTNAMSENFETLPLGSKSQKMFESKANRTGFEENNSKQDDNRKYMDNQSTRTQKEYIIRHNKAQNLPAQSKASVNPQQLQQTLAKEFRDLKENFDLEDTIPFDVPRESNVYSQKLGSTQQKGETTTGFWEQVLKDLERNDLQSAYEKALEAGKFIL